MRRLSLALTLFGSDKVSSVRSQHSLEARPTRRFSFLSTPLPSSHLPASSSYPSSFSEGVLKPVLRVSSSSSAVRPASPPSLFSCQRRSSDKADLRFSFFGSDIQIIRDSTGRFTRRSASSRTGEGGGRPSFWSRRVESRSLAGAGLGRRSLDWMSI